MGKYVFIFNKSYLTLYLSMDSNSFSKLDPGPDPHSFKKPDPYPHLLKKLDLDPDRIKSMRIRNTGSSESSLL
jgi:hypothetical protein